MQRVLIIGPCGAGKSTLARRLAPALGLPLIHRDTRPRMIARLEAAGSEVDIVWLRTPAEVDALSRRLGVAC